MSRIYFQREHREHKDVSYRTIRTPSERWFHIRGVVKGSIYLELLAATSVTCSRCTECLLQHTGLFLHGYRKVVLYPDPIPYKNRNLQVPCHWRPQMGLQLGIRLGDTTGVPALSNSRGEPSLAYASQSIRIEYNISILIGFILYVR